MTTAEELFRKCLAASLCLHAAFFLFFRFLPLPGFRPAAGIEIDLSHSFLGGTGPAKLGAPKALVPKAVGVPLPAERGVPQLAQPVPPKDWVLPGPQTKVMEEPPAPAATPGGAVGGTGTSPLTGGSGAGADYGTPNGTGDGGSGLLQWPRLLNRDEMLANLRRFYPENERRAGHEGSVVVALHIGADGRVSPIDVVSSAGAAFDEAARKVGALMRFSPAVGPRGPVAVKLPQTILFRLEDQ